MSESRLHRDHNECNSTLYDGATVNQKERNYDFAAWKQIVEAWRRRQRGFILFGIRVLLNFHCKLFQSVVTWHFYNILLWRICPTGTEMPSSRLFYSLSQFKYGVTSMLNNTQKGNQSVLCTRFQSVNQWCNIKCCSISHLLRSKC